MFDPGGLPLARPAAVFGVFRYRPDSSPRYQLLPHVVCEAIQVREGAEPGSASFRYVFAHPFGDSSAPSRFEQVYPLDASGRHVVAHDDRLVVRRYRPDGSFEVVFDGFAQVPQADLSGSGETVTFQCLGTPVREWDTPIGGAIYRDAGDVASGDDVATGRPTRLNPGGLANAVPEADEAGTSPFEYPTFLDERVCKSRGIGRRWTLGMALRYLLSTANTDTEYVNYAPFTVGATAVLDDAVSAIRPASDDQPIDFADPSTYTLEPILCPDVDLTGKAWPEAVQGLIAPHGFGMAFRLTAESDGDPIWHLHIYRKDRDTQLKPLYLQHAGEVLDPGRTNLGALRLQRDVSGLANRWVADTAPVRYEASFVLAPGFAPNAADDNNAAAYDQWRGNNPDPVKYREYVFDETGDGHYDFAGSSFVTATPTSLDAVLGEPDTDDVPAYAGRRRPGIATLISTDAQGKPRRAELWVSTDYAGAKPGVWDRTGTWQRVHSSEWRLLDDRLGIQLTTRDPSSWNIGGSEAAGMPFGRAGKVNVVKSQCDPDAANPRFWFRLTCVIEGDQDLDVVAEHRLGSPTIYDITRRDDTRDRHRKEVISRRSHLATSALLDVSARDDSDAALAHCEARRRTHELARFAGTATIPRFTAAYRVGDRIRAVVGRDLDLRTNTGAGGDEAPIYPAIVGIDWRLSGDKQMTVLQLSDRRAEATSAAHDVL